MTASEAIHVAAEDRFERFARINWWDQKLLAKTKVLVIGAGALGNELIKNLALLGVGHITVVDLDRVEQSNLSRSVLFRESDEGRPKAACAAAAARDIYPRLDVEAIAGNVLADVGLGWFRWADVVVGAVDNREARIFVNGVCARLDRPWIDGGIDVFQGVARGFSPPHTACYECTMGETDWRLVNQRRSCGLLAARAFAAGGTPTTPTVASVIGALQAQEVVKLVHGLPTLQGKGYVFDGDCYDGYVVNYPIRSDCPWHEPVSPVEAADDLTCDSPLAEIWQRGEKLLGTLDALDLPREVVHSAHCAHCGRCRDVWSVAENVQEAQLRCDQCGGECLPDFAHSITTEQWLALTPRAIGLPNWDILWARRGERIVGIELAGDAPKQRPVLTGRNGQHVTQIAQE